MSDSVLSVDLSRNYFALQVHGPDAGAFLQSQLAADLRSCAHGTAIWTAWVDARGRPRALLHAMHCTHNKWTLLTQSSFADNLQRLQMFVLRAQATITAVDVIQGELGPSPSAPVTGGGIALGGGRVITLAAPGIESGATRTPADDCTPADGIMQWRARSALCGEAQLDAADCATEIPQSLGLTLESGYSLRKGCYPGQEIISRVHYRGRPPRRLVTTIAPAAPADARFVAPLASTGNVIAQSLRPISREPGLSSPDAAAETAARHESTPHR